MGETYRVIYRDGTYMDTGQPPPVDETVWAIINLEITDGGDAYQQLLRTLGAAPT
ncbi:hypothetical protein [Mycolicibacter senuensis]|nr:hypothetical protein [Mycolicibacter senuensis]